MIAAQQGCCSASAWGTPLSLPPPLPYLVSDSELEPVDLPDLTDALIEDRPSRPPPTPLHAQDAADLDALLRHSRSHARRYAACGDFPAIPVVPPSDVGGLLRRSTLDEPSPVSEMVIASGVALASAIGATLGVILRLA